MHKLQEHVCDIPFIKYPAKLPELYSQYIEDVGGLLDKHACMITRDLHKEPFGELLQCISNHQDLV